MEFFDRKYKRIAAEFDGEIALSEAERDALLQDPERARYAEALPALRSGAQAAARVTPRIEDAQMGAFMAGIREGVATPEHAPHRGFWAAVSLTAAAMVIAVSTFIVLDGGPQAVQANEVESISTDLEGARLDVYDSDEGITTIWIVNSGDDL
jgi:hypothetical protein